MERKYQQSEKIAFFIKHNLLSIVGYENAKKSDIRYENGKLIIEIKIFEKTPQDVAERDFEMYRSAITELGLSSDDFTTTPWKMTGRKDFDRSKQFVIDPNNKAVVEKIVQYETNMRIDHIQRAFLEAQRLLQSYAGITSKDGEFSMEKIAAGARKKTEEDLRSEGIELSRC